MGVGEEGGVITMQCFQPCSLLPAKHMEAHKMAQCLLVLVMFVLERKEKYSNAIAFVSHPLCVILEILCRYCVFFFHFLPKLSVKINSL